MNANYEVVRNLAGQWYPQSTHSTAREARDAAIRLAAVLNAEYCNRPYACGVRQGETLITEDAAKDAMTEWHSLTRDQQAAEIAARS